MPGKKSAFKMNITYDFQGMVISIRIITLLLICISIISLNFSKFLNIRENGAKVCEFFYQFDRFE
jgi:hypothetical protein